MWKSVYPLFTWDQQEGRSQNTYRFAGTGFFVRIGDFLTLITAGHVLANLDSDENIQLVISERAGERGKIIVLSGASIWKDSEDFAAFIIAPETIRSFDQPPVPLTVHRDFLMPLDDVFTFGFPFNILEIPVNNGLIGEKASKAVLGHMYLKGYVTTDRFGKYIKGFKSFDKSYQLNFPGYPGLSGAPLLTVKTGKPEVAGIFYKSQDTSMSGIDVSFALTSTHEPIRELERIIETRGP